MGTLKVAVIGAGNIARTAHLPALAQMKEAEVVALCDSRPAAMEALTTEFSIPHCFTDYRELLRAARPDAVVICVPNAFHYEIALAALEGGCHVLCEKPPALNYAQALEMHEAAEKHGKVLCYNLCHRYRGEVESIKGLLREGALGTVYAGRVQATRRRAVPGWGVFTHKALQGGGPLLDIGVHMLDTALYLLDYPKLSYAAAGSYDLIGKQGGEGCWGPWDGEAFSVEDSLFGFLRFENGCSLQLETSFALHSGQRETTLMNVSLYGDRAGATLSPCMLHTSEGAAQVDRSIPFQARDYARAAAPDFVRAVLEGIRPKADSQTALLVQEAVDGLYRSAETGKPFLF